MCTHSFSCSQRCLHVWMCFSIQFYTCQSQSLSCLFHCHTKPYTYDVLWIGWKYKTKCCIPFSLYSHVFPINRVEYMYGRVLMFLYSMQDMYCTRKKLLRIKMFLGVQCYASQPKIFIIKKRIKSNLTIFSILNCI